MAETGPRTGSKIHARVGGVALALLVLYFLSMSLMTQRFVTGFTSGKPGIVRLADTQWQVTLFRPGAFIEQKLLGDFRAGAQLYLRNETLKQYLEKRAQIQTQAPGRE